MLEAKELKQAATSSSVSTAPSFISNSELADQSNCSSVLGTLNGERAEGTRWLNMPRVSEPKNLVAFGGCPTLGPPSICPIRRTSTWGGDQEGGSGEWSPSEFKVLEYVDWDFSDRRPPKAKRSAVSAAGGKGKKKGKK